MEVKWYLTRSIYTRTYSLFSFKQDIMSLQFKNIETAGLWCVEQTRYWVNVILEQPIIGSIWHEKSS